MAKKIISLKFLLLFVILGVLFIPFIPISLYTNKGNRSDYWYQVTMAYSQLHRQMWGTQKNKRLLAIPSLAYMIVALILGSFLALNGSNHWHKVWLKFDYLFNAIFDGVWNETISSRLGKSIYHEHEPVFFRHVRYDKIVSWALDQLDPNHCQDSINWGVGYGLEHRAR